MWHWLSTLGLRPLNTLRLSIGEDNGRQPRAAAFRAHLECDSGECPLRPGEKFRRLFRTVRFSCAHESISCRAECIALPLLVASRFAGNAGGASTPKAFARHGGQAEQAQLATASPSDGGRGGYRLRFLRRMPAAGMWCPPMRTRRRTRAIACSTFATHR